MMLMQSKQAVCKLATQLLCVQIALLGREGAISLTTSMTASATNESQILQGAAVHFNIIMWSATISTMKLVKKVEGDMELL